MAVKDPKKVLAENVAALIEDRQTNPWQLAASAKVGPATVTRILAGETAVGLDVIQAVADRFGLESWQVLYPGLDPTEPPRDLRRFSQDGIDLAVLVSKIEDPKKLSRAMAICRLALQDEIPETRAAVETPEPEPPAPAPTAKPVKARRK